MHGVMLALAELGTHLSLQEELTTSKCSSSHGLCTLVPGAFIAEMTHQMPCRKADPWG